MRFFRFRFRLDHQKNENNDYKMAHSFNSILFFDILIRPEFNQTLILNTILGYILSYLFEYSTYF